MDLEGFFVVAVVVVWSCFVLGGAIYSSQNLTGKSSDWIAELENSLKITYVSFGIKASRFKALDESFFPSETLYIIY